jgi:hypothetical protein
MRRRTRDEIAALIRTRRSIERRLPQLEAAAIEAEDSAQALKPHRSRRPQRALRREVDLGQEHLVAAQQALLRTQGELITYFSEPSNRPSQVQHCIDLLFQDFDHAEAPKTLRSQDAIRGSRIEPKVRTAFDRRSASDHVKDSMTRTSGNPRLQAATARRLCDERLAELSIVVLTHELENECRPRSSTFTLLESLRVGDFDRVIDSEFTEGRREVVREFGDAVGPILADVMYLRPHLGPEREAVVGSFGDFSLS